MRRGWTRRGAKDPQYWLEMACSVWQTNDRISGDVWHLSLAVWVHRCYMVETSTIGPWMSMGRLKKLDAGNCAMHGVVCLWLLHDSHQSITFASVCPQAAKRHEHLQVSHTKKATNKWRTFIAQNLTIHNGALAQRNASHSHTLLVFGLYQAGPQTKQNLRHWYISI